ncbi:hypothetical protein LXL04_006236 [Taraxacum kok-saghyz]
MTYRLQYGTSSVGGFYAVNRRGQVLLATVNESTIVPFVSGQLNNLELAVNLAKRGNLPGAENLYFGTLLTKGKLNAFESLELSRATPKVVAAFAERREFDKILIYSKQVGYAPDYLFLLQTLLRSDPQSDIRPRTESDIRPRTKHLGLRTESDIRGKFPVCDFFGRTESEAKGRTESVVCSLTTLSNARTTDRVRGLQSESENVFIEDNSSKLDAVSLPAVMVFTRYVRRECTCLSLRGTKSISNKKALSKGITRSLNGAPSRSPLWSAHEEQTHRSLGNPRTTGVKPGCITSSWDRTPDLPKEANVDTHLIWKVMCTCVGTCVYPDQRNAEEKKSMKSNVAKKDESSKLLW